MKDKFTSDILSIAYKNINPMLYELCVNWSWIVDHNIHENCYPAFLSFPQKNYVAGILTLYTKSHSSLLIAEQKNQIKESINSYFGNRNVVAIISLRATT